MRNNARRIWARTPQNCVTTNRGPTRYWEGALPLRNGRPFEAYLFVVRRFIVCLRKSQNINPSCHLDSQTATSVE